MSIQKMAEVWKYSKNGGSALLVELAIADHINGAGLAWPSIKHLAQKTKLSERQVQRVIKKLEQTGELEVKRDRHYNVYRINLHDILSGGDILTPLEDDTQGAKGDIQGAKGDIQGMEDDIQGLIDDTAMSLKSLTIKGTVKGTIKEPEDFSNLKTEAEEIWVKLLNALEREKNKLFRQVSYLHDISLDSDILTVWVSTLGEADYLNDRAARTIERILVGIIVRSIHVKFAVKTYEFSHI